MHTHTPVIPSAIACLRDAFRVLVFVAAASAGCGGSAPSVPDLPLEEPPARIMPTDGTVLQDAVGFAIQDGEIVVADALAPALLRYDHEGRRLQARGGAGEGPGEFERIMRIEAGPDGSLWLSDIGKSGLMVLEAEGIRVSHLRGLFSWATFAPVGGGRALVLRSEEGPPIGLLHPDGTVETLTPPEDLGRFLSQESIGTRALTFSLIPAGTDRAYLLDQRDLTVWHLRLHADGTVSAARLPRPESVADEIAKERDRMLAALPGGGNLFALLADAWDTDARGRLLLKTGAGPLALLYDPAQGWAAIRSRRYPRSGLRDMAIRGDTLYLLYETELQVVPLGSRGALFTP